LLKRFRSFSRNREYSGNLSAYFITKIIRQDIIPDVKCFFAFRFTGRAATADFIARSKGRDTVATMNRAKCDNALYGNKPSNDLRSSLNYNKDFLNFT